jgi:hypothetical protein
MLMFALLRLQVDMRSMDVVQLLLLHLLRIVLVLLRVELCDGLAMLLLLAEVVLDGEADTVRCWATLLLLLLDKLVRAAALLLLLLLLHLLLFLLQHLLLVQVRFAARLGELSRGDGVVHHRGDGVRLSLRVAVQRMQQWLQATLARRGLQASLAATTLLLLLLLSEVQASLLHRRSSIVRLIDVNIMRNERRLVYDRSIADPFLRRDAFAPMSRGGTVVQGHEFRRMESRLSHRQSLGTRHDEQIRRT